MKRNFLNNAGLLILANDPLRLLFEDKDFEVRFYAKQGVKRLNN